MADGKGSYGRIVLRQLALEAGTIQDVLTLLAENGFSGFGNGPGRRYS